MDPNEPVAVQEEISDSDSGQAMSTHGGLGGVGAGPLERDTDRLLSNSTAHHSPLASVVTPGGDGEVVGSGCTRCCRACWGSLPSLVLRRWWRLLAVFLTPVLLLPLLAWRSSCGQSPGINFGLWLLFGAPVMLLMLLSAWLYLAGVYCDDSFLWCRRKLCFGKREASRLRNLQWTKRAKAVIVVQYKKLGRIQYAEICVLVLLVVLILLWLFREPKFFSGWASVFRTEDNKRHFYFSDTSTAMLIVFVLFIIPSQPFCNRGCPEVGSAPRLLDWGTVEHKLPWGVVILMGSGFAIADAAETSGLSSWVGEKLSVLGTLSPVVLAFLVTCMVVMATEVLSNVAAATLLLPILAKLAVQLEINPLFLMQAVQLEINPLFLMIPATLSASYAFMLPVATPPNAIAFSFGRIKVYEMVVTGIFLNVIAIGVVTLSLNTIGRAVFGLGSFPHWANSTNFTTTSCVT